METRGCLRSLGLLKDCHPVVVTGHSFPVNEAGPQLERIDGLDDERKST